LLTPATALSEPLGLCGIIPGAQHWPSFNRNVSQQFEARFSSVKIGKSLKFAKIGNEFKKNKFGIDEPVATEILNAEQHHHFLNKGQFFAHLECCLFFVFDAIFV
jgi:hypothetical protein